MATKTARKVSKVEAKVRGKASKATAKPETKVRNAKVSKATAKPETKATKAKATPQPRAATGPGKGSGIQLADNMRIILKRRDNPKRPGTASYERFNLYLTKKPKTVAEALKAGITRADLRWDAARDFIELH